MNTPRTNFPQITKWYHVGLLKKWHRLPACGLHAITGWKPYATFAAELAGSDPFPQWKITVDEALAAQT